MNRIDATFAKLQAAGKRAFVSYICAGDPTPDATPAIAKVLEECGTDILELGVPFSDPMADGTVNQLASERALKAGASVKTVFANIRAIRATSEIPLVLFTYLNPVYAYGFEKFFQDAAAAGADGVLLLDLPPDEQDCNPELAGNGQLHIIRLIAPTSPLERIRAIAKRAQGFIYYVSREGVTGLRDDIVQGLEEQVALVRSNSPVPAVVGFGIYKPAQALTVAKCADGVVVGSAIVKTIAENAASPELHERLRGLVKPLVEAVKSV